MSPRTPPPSIARTGRYLRRLLASVSRSRRATRPLLPEGVGEDLYGRPRRRIAVAAERTCPPEGSAIRARQRYSTLDPFGVIAIEPEQLVGFIDKHPRLLPPRISQWLMGQLRTPCESRTGITAGRGDGSHRARRDRLRSGLQVTNCATLGDPDPPLPGL